MNPAPVPPEERDWLVVLETGCDECGWAPGEPTLVTETLEKAVPRWEKVLSRETASQRPEATVWSPVEYACHVRDMVRLLGERVSAMLNSDDPTFEDWDGNAKAVELDYHAVPPAEIAADMKRCTAATVPVLAAVSGQQWVRKGHRSDGALFTVASLAVYMSHEVEHHLRDVAG